MFGKNLVWDTFSLNQAVLTVSLQEQQSSDNTHYGSKICACS